jgi:hypothetical protein
MRAVCERAWASACRAWSRAAWRTSTPSRELGLAEEAHEFGVEDEQIEFVLCRGDVAADSLELFVRGARFGNKPAFCLQGGEDLLFDVAIDCFGADVGSGRTRAAGVATGAVVERVATVGRRCQVAGDLERVANGSDPREALERPGSHREE